MRRKSGELNIFSMSALDLFASALGAFILITLILMPYYKKEVPSETPTTCPVCPTFTCGEMCPMPTIPEPTVCPEIVPTPTPVCEPTPTTELVDNLMVYNMRWNVSGDIDLHVYTPDGHFSYENPTLPGAPGEMTLDNIDGGENSLEIWMSYSPTPGDYKICHKNLASQTITVVGVLNKPSGPVAIAPQSVRPDAMECPLRFRIDSDYTFTQLN